MLPRTCLEQSRAASGSSGRVWADWGEAMRMQCRSNAQRAYRSTQSSSRRSRGGITCKQGHP
eukprot:4833084-Alexandrium_andersonii.AAC.1